MTLRERLDHAAGKLSYALSLTMLASPFVLIALQPAAPPPANRTAQSVPSAGKDSRGPAVASWIAADGKAAAAPALKTRPIPVIEVKVRREEKTSREAPAEKPSAEKSLPPAASATPAAGAAAVSSPQNPAPASPPPATATPAAPQATAPPPQPPAWTEAEVSAALRACLTTLAPLSIEMEARPPVKENVCGLPAPISIRRIGADKVEIQPAALVNCGMATVLNDWLVKVAQPAAREAFGSPIVKLTGTSGYVCRNRNGAAVGPISEHAFGNALDISGFVLADGRSIIVASHWGATARDAKPVTAHAPPASPPPAAEPAAAPPPAKKAAAGKTAGDKQRSALGGPSPDATAQPASASASATPAPAPSPERSKEATFLRRVHAGACPMFGTVLGPEANEAHRDHLHIDLKGRKRSGICE